MSDFIKVYASVQKANDAPDLASALGDMLFAWSWAERAMSNALAVMLSVPTYKASRLYQKLPNYRSRTQAMFLLIELHPEFEPLRAGIAKLSKLSKRRNDWVHGSFIKGHSEVRAINLDEGLESERRSKPIKAADILNHSEAVRTCANSLYQTLKQLPAYTAWSATQTEARKKAAGLQDKP